MTLAPLARPALAPHVVATSSGVLTGCVVDHDGAPIPSFALGLDPAAMAPFADPRGRFELRGLPLGRLRLYFHSPFAAACLLQASSPERPGEPALELRVERGRTVGGRVVGARGEPIAGAQVFAGETLRGDGRRLAPHWAAQATMTDDRGRFRLRGVPLGAVGLVADHARGRSSLVALPAGGADATVDLELEKTAAIEGRLTSRGRSVPGRVVARVALRGGASATFAQATLPDGRFRLERLGAGTWEVLGYPQPAGAPGPDGSASASARLEPGRTLRLELDLR